MRNLLTLDLGSGYAMACAALHHEKAEKISEHGTVWWMNHPILNERESYHEVSGVSLWLGLQTTCIISNVFPYKTL